VSIINRQNIIGFVIVVCVKLHIVLAQFFMLYIVMRLKFAVDKPSFEIEYFLV